MTATTMIGRSLRHATRGVDALLLGVFLPILMLLLFVYVFGGAMNTGMAYVNYVVPGIILLTAGYGASQTAIGVTNDMVRGIIDRFRSMPISASSVLTGHVTANLLRNLLSTLLLTCVALFIGFRPAAGPIEWLATAGLLSLFIVAMAWLSVVFGLIAKTVEGAGGFSFFVLFLPYISSAFVPTHTMPRALQVFAAHQPVTPIIETIRGLLLGTPIGNNGWLAVAWCGGILAVSYPLARLLFNRGR